MKRITNADRVKSIRKKRRRPDADGSGTLPDPPAEFQVGQRVALRIGRQTEMGYKAIINTTHEGILYKNEVFQPLKRGQEIDGFIKKLRPDNKIDLCLHEPGYKKVNTLSEKILTKLEAKGGFIAVTDKTPPETISAIFGLSKKTYKKIIGGLYKNRRITIEKDGIRLRQKGKAMGTGATSRLSKNKE